MSEPPYAELILEAREYVDALQGGESENWLHLVQHVDMLADALVEAQATIAKVREHLVAITNGPTITIDGIDANYEAKRWANRALSFLFAPSSTGGREDIDEPELVEVYLTGKDVGKLAHLLVQLSPATSQNAHATVRRLMREMNIKESDDE